MVEKECENEKSDDKVEEEKNKARVMKECFSDSFALFGTTALKNCRR